MGKAVGLARRLQDVGAKARGRMPLRYELEIIPYLCGDIPDGITHCSFAWERGSKLFVTEAEAVNAATHAVFWKQYLRQTATMYKEGVELLPKDYAFKVQSVKSGSKPGEEKRKTVGKVHINLAQFCSEALDAQPQEVMLHLKPAGKLKVCIKATWLRNARVDADAMTEVTGASLYADSQYDEDEEGGGGGGGRGGDDGEIGDREEEQDLSGFDPETGEPLPHHGRRGRGRGHGEASTSGQQAEEEEVRYDEEGNPLPARKSRRHGGGRHGGKGSRRNRSRMKSEDGIPEDGEADHGEGNGEGYDEYGDPGGEDGDGAERRRRGAGSKASKGEGRPKLQMYPGADGAGGGGTGGGGNGGLQIEAGRQLHRRGWRDVVCCCCPPRAPVEDPLEGDSLLAKGRIRSSTVSNENGGMRR